jgi:hypothetical protein
MSFFFAPKADLPTIAVMPSLDFKGKSFVYAHHLPLPFRELVI